MRDMRGFYDKFQVIRRETGEEETGPTFTLLPDHDQHALPALLSYAESCETVNPGLAKDLRDLVAEFS
jgi:hypothetical protein